MDVVKKKEEYGNYYKGLVKKKDWLSYYQQIKLILETGVDNYVEIGVASLVVADFFKRRGLKVTTVDTNKCFNPDVVGDIRALSMKENSTDLICAFQVLEHMPYEDSLKGLQEMHRVTKKYCIISLPFDATIIKTRLDVPFVHIGKTFYIEKKSKKNKHKDVHYWEMGRKGYTLEKIKKDIRDIGFTIKKDFFCEDNPFHYFFVLEKE